MKNLFKKIQLIVYLFVSVHLVGQNDTLKYENYKAMMSDIFGDYKQKFPAITFLKYKLIYPVTNIYHHHKGNLTDTIISPIKYLGLVNDLNVSNFETHPKINLSYLQSVLIAYTSKTFTPISLSLAEYEEFKDSAILLNTISFNNNKVIDNSPAGFYPLKKKLLFASSALNEVFKSNQINFLFNDSLFLTNVPSQRIGATIINFADGSGYQNLVQNNIYNINYPSFGIKTIKVKIVVDGDTLYSASNIQISPPPNLALQVNNCATQPLAPDIMPVNISTPSPLNGNMVMGEYAVWFSNCNLTGNVVKPYIVSTGFNPGNGKQLLPGLISLNYTTFNLGNNVISIPDGFQWNGAWRGTHYETVNGGYSKRFSPTEAAQCGEGSSNQNRYLDRLRDEGYDIVILHYDKGDDFIQNNAALFRKLINEINTQKFANYSYFENVVEGYSAGGVSTRLALAQAEALYKQGLGLHPHTKMWVSVETENQGANVPLGFSYLLDYQKNPLNLVPSLNPLHLAADLINSLMANFAYDFSNNPTANQLNLYMASQNGGTHPYRTTLLNDFASIPLNTQNGYPQFCRKVGISQGSSKGTQTPHIYDYMFDSKLQFGLGNLVATSLPSTCGGSYPWYLPSTEKRTTARWWGSINPSSDIFTGYTVLNGQITIFPKLCFNLPFVGCYCLGPFTVGGIVQLSSSNKAKPSVPNNYDDAPASALSAHLELYSTSAYPFYNNFLAGNAHAWRDPSLHAFAPTISALDLRNPNTGNPVSNFTDPVGLGLMNINNNSSQPDLRFGFPYLTYPLNHYQVTPYDAVFAIGINNGTDVNNNPRPDNQFHIEDPQTMMGDYLARVEVAPEELFMSNQTVGSSASTYPGYTSGYKAEFEARNKIIAGKTDFTGAINIYALYSNPNYLTPNGDFKVSIGAKAIMHSGEFVEFLPGTEVPIGAELDAFVQPFACPNLLFRTSNPPPTNNNHTYSSIMANGIGFDTDKAQDAIQFNNLQVYPNPNNGIFNIINNNESPSSEVLIFDFTGKQVNKSSIPNKQVSELDIKNLENGMYLLTIDNQKFKLIIAK